MFIVKTAFFDTKPYEPDFFNEANKNLGFKITYLGSRLTLETVPLAQGHDAVCVFVNDTVSKEIIDRLCQDKVRLIALRGAGYNNVDLQAAFGKIHVVRVPSYSPHAVAEHAVALMLALNRKIHKAYYRTRDNNFTLNGLMGFDMCGKTAGIIGTGQIGKAAVEILKGLGMKVLAYDAYPDKAYQQKTGFDYVDLDTLYKDSDIISLHCPLNKETRHIINQQSISKMKPGVMIINTGRGLLIDSKALIDGLKSGKIGYAGLDVYEEESEYFFEDFSNSGIPDDVLARLLSFPNVLVTSHQGFFTKEALHNIAHTTLDNIRQYFENGALPNEICYKCSVTPCPRLKTGKCF
ncbi:MAG: 2-hydroxyacid dehydrogenase [Candidatus Omnitrophota bacterium]